MEHTYQETFFLSAGEANAEQEMALPILVAKLIDIATAHANSLNIGNPVMKDLHAGWVLARLTVEMNSYPKVNDDYTIATWVESFNRHFSERAFSITSPSGKVYGYARSVWMVMETVNRTNLGLSHLHLPEELISGVHPPIEKQMKHTQIVESDNSEAGQNGVLIANHKPHHYRFKYCDLDSYRHVNTVRYVSMLLNRFSLEHHDNYMISRLELSFLHEAKYDMNTTLLRSDLEEPDGRIISSFLLKKSSDASPLLFARIFSTPDNYTE